MRKVLTLFYPRQSENNNYCLQDIVLTCGIARAAAATNYVVREDDYYTQKKNYYRGKPKLRVMILQGTAKLLVSWAVYKNKRVDRRFRQTQHGNSRSGSPERNTLLHDSK